MLLKKFWWQGRKGGKIRGGRKGNGAKDSYGR